MGGWPKDSLAFAKALLPDASRALTSFHVARRNSVLASGKIDSAIRAVAAPTRIIPARGVSCLWRISPRPGETHHNFDTKLKPRGPFWRNVSNSDAPGMSTATASRSDVQLV